MNSLAPVDTADLPIDAIKDERLAEAVRSLVKEVEAHRIEAGGGLDWPQGLEARLARTFTMSPLESALTAELLRRRRGSLKFMLEWLADQPSKRAQNTKLEQLRGLIARARGRLKPHGISVRFDANSDYFIPRADKDRIREALTAGTQIALQPAAPETAPSLAALSAKRALAARATRSKAKSLAGCPVGVWRMLSTGPCQAETLAAGTDSTSDGILGALERLRVAGHVTLQSQNGIQRWKLTDQGFNAAVKAGVLS